jgi:ParB/RepB/Spo0J family partition protein
MSDALDVQLDRLIPNPDNPRETLGELAELAESIAAIGVLQRLLVTPVTDTTFMVVDGHRRYWAMRSIDYTLPVPVEVRTMDRPTALAAAVAAGTFSRAISPIDQAKAFRQLEEMGMTRAQIEAATGVNQPTISTRLRLLELSPAQQLAVHEGRMTLDAAKKATYEIRRRRPDRAPRPSRKPKNCPTCGLPTTRPAAGAAEVFAPRARVDESLPPVPPADRSPTRPGEPAGGRLLVCDDCEFTCQVDEPRRLIRHCVEVHGRQATRAERTPSRIPSPRTP